MWSLHVHVEKYSRSSTDSDERFHWTHSNLTLVQAVSIPIATHVSRGLHVKLASGETPELAKTQPRHYQMLICKSRTLLSLRHCLPVSLACVFLEMGDVVDCLPPTGAV